QPEGSSQKVEKTLAEDLAGAHIEHIFEQTPRNLAGDYGPVEKTLMIGRKNEGSLPGQLFFTAHSQSEKDSRDKSHEPAKNVPGEGEQTIAVESGEHPRVFRIGSQHRIPTGKSGPRPAGATPGQEHRIHQLAHGINPGNDLVIGFRAYLPLYGDDNFHALHRVKAKIKLQVR